ncbi:MAG: Crp/Fnr family transcriptional regulator [Winogradskyella sp.]|uniref:Crp/Fnr family transcriptional regulator n=1 Tax=Winogradskyella sp. TaxID=1883156 RepID=UPI001809445D|nr:Crp/Fnr family transcriptional regulator [Winogradskyella sp.]MBT8243793.1 Crp/Fnr family transcriptional regulator [Winogradskyella sp.]NNK22015.1 Crp/Fnr family transcriptional regulator [Winogradskyella sp.]
MSKCESCIVREFNSLKSLTRDELMRVSACKTGKIFDKGRVIFEEGDSVNGVYCVKDGVCKLTKLSENGKDQVVKLIVKGGLLGKRSLVTNQVSSLTATALTEMEMCFIPKAEIMNDLEKNPNFTLDVLRQMTEDLKVSEHSIVNMAQKSVKKRMAEALLYIYDDFGTDDEGYLTIILSREDYASIVGTATESAIRILSQFKKDDFISTSGKRIKIENLSGLKWVE